jgi:hypothetical protein
VISSQKVAVDGKAIIYTSLPLVAAVPRTTIANLSNNRSGGGRKC